MNAVTDIAGLDALPLDEDFSRAEARLRALARMTEIGMGRMERLHERGLAEEDEGGAPANASGGWAQDYGKISRGVRLNIVLEERLEKALRDRRAGLEAVRRERAAKAAEDAAARDAAELAAKRDEAEAARVAARRAANAPQLAREDAVEKVMGDAIGRVARGDWDEMDRLHNEMSSLLEDEYGDYEDYRDHPVSETVRRLCDDLGLDPDWERWAKMAWAVEEAEAGVEGSPYARAAVEDSS